ncbi:MAG: hypothetical protein J6K42_05800 [Clostridia bacterium]|nr:hypothetical protein [Clostridia bacterium]
MNKELIILNDSNQMINKTIINKLITEINTLKINKSMKQLLLIASLNLLSSIKTTKGLTYQLENFRNQGKIYPEKTKSKYINNMLKDIKKMSVSDFTNNINNLINFLNTNNITIKI